MRSNTHTVSVIIPVHNGERYLAETLQSVFDQDRDKVEVLVINDGSTDGTAAILDDIGDRIRVFNRPREGVSAARNFGLAEATGEYIVFLDADDLLLPGKLSGQAAALDQDPHISSVHSGWHLIDELGARIGTVTPWRRAPDLDLPTWLTESPFYLPAMMFRKEPLERSGGFDASLQQAEDVDLLLRMSLQGSRTVWLKQPTVSYRQHPDSTMRNGTQQAESITRVMDAFFARTDLPQNVKELEDQIMQNTFMWSVWHMFETGHIAGIETYLRRSREYLEKPALHAARLWLDRLVRNCISRGRDPEDLRTLWPAFQTTLELEGQEWRECEAGLERWLKFLQVMARNSKLK